MRILYIPFVYHFVFEPFALFVASVCRAHALLLLRFMLSRVYI